MPIQVEVWGDYACFTRPELKVERMSYDVITPSAARGLLEAIVWHPGMRWVVDKIHVMNPVRFESIRRNEVKSKISASNVRSVMNGGSGALYLCTSDDIQQRAATVLRDVHYVIEAHFDMTEKAAPGDNPGKFSEMMRRRLEKGQCYHSPCFGCREFPASFRQWTGGAIPTAYPDSEKELGLMLYDMDFSDQENIIPMFFRAKLENGVLNIPAPDSPEVLR